MSDVIDRKGQLSKETTVRFERLLPGPIERIWEFLTESGRLEWLGGGTIEPRPGGAVSIADGQVRGVVTQWKPPRLLAYTWIVFMEGEAESHYSESYVKFELEPDAANVRLILTHRPIGEGFEAQTLMGWHTALEILETILKGETPEPRDVIRDRNRLLYGVKTLKR